MKRRAENGCAASRPVVGEAGVCPRFSSNVLRSARKVNVFGLYSLLILLPGPVQAAGNAYIEVGAGFKTGDFGTAVRSDLYFVQPVLGYVAETYDLSISLPYLSLSSTGGGLRTTESGIGDVLLRGGRVLLPKTKGGLSVHGAVAVKLPTADEKMGLGTGETDYGAFLTLHQRIETFRLSLMTGYLKIGDPAGLDYNDSYLYGIGLSRTSGKTGVYGSLEGRRAIVPGADNPLELNLGLVHALSARDILKGNTFFGLNDGGPAFGISAGYVRWF